MREFVFVYNNVWKIERVICGSVGAYFLELRKLNQLNVVIQILKNYVFLYIILLKWVDVDWFEDNMLDSASKNFQANLHGDLQNIGVRTELNTLRAELHQIVWSKGLGLH